MAVGSVPESLERAVELVFPEEQAIRLLRAAEEQDVAAGGVGEADLLKRVLNLAGLPGDGPRSTLGTGDPRQPVADPR
jgi:hypothetical protein